MTRRSIWRTIPTRRRRPLAWYAGKDGEAHARRAEADARTLCGVPAVAPCLSWPAVTRCEACVRLALEDTT